jgi:hypothetical protein
MVQVKGIIMISNMDKMYTANEIISPQDNLSVTEGKRDNI